MWSAACFSKLSLMNPAHAYLFVYCLWLLSHYHGKVRVVARVHVTHKAKYNLLSDPLQTAC